MEGKCRFDASPFSVSGMLYYIFFLFGSSQFLVHNAQLQNSLRKFYIKC